MRILIVDDSRIMRNIVKNTLKALHYPDDVFVEAPDGVQAWEVLEAQDISLLLLDWNMPNLNGLDLVKRLRANAKYQSLPIVMVTSEAAKYNVIEAVKAGVSDYLVKPVTEKGLEEKIRRVLDRRPS
ncbi:MAG TPA: response regulator [Spirochaetia bacterium]|nr:response regulator [Spirochaetia bacterium]